MRNPRVLSHRAVVAVCLSLSLPASIMLLSGCSPVPANAGGPSRETTDVKPAAPTGNPSPNTVRVERSSVNQMVPAVGTLIASQTTNIGPQVAGRVEEIFVDVGDVVTKGQAVVQLDPSFFEIDLEQKRAEFTEAEIRVEQTKVELARIEELWNKGTEPATTGQLLDNARFAHQLAKSKADQSQQGVRASERRLDEATIRAPYAGIITQRLVDPGEPVTSTFVVHVMEIQQLDPLELHFSLAQANFEVVEAGMPIQYRVNGIPSLAGVGTIDRVFPDLVEATRSFRCRALIANPGLKLRPGMLMEVGIVVGTVPDALTLPHAAVFPTPGGGQAVRVPTATGYEERPVKTGIMTVDKIQIVDGLSEGDEVLLVQATAAE